MKAVKAKMFSLMPSSMKCTGAESAVTLRNEVELRMKMNSVSRMVIMIKVVVVILIIFLPTIKIIAQMSWYDRAKGRRKFRVFEEDDQPMQVLDSTFYDNDDCYTGSIFRRSLKRRMLSTRKLMIHSRSHLVSNLKP